MYKNGLKSFLDKDNLLYHCQYGFRDTCSTQHALIDNYGQWNSVQF